LSLIVVIGCFLSSMATSSWQLTSSDVAPTLADLLNTMSDEDEEEQKETEEENEEVDYDNHGSSSTRSGYCF
jgi:hypothetical protein